MNSSDTGMVARPPSAFKAEIVMAGSRLEHFTIAEMDNITREHRSAIGNASPRDLKSRAVMRFVATQPHSSDSLASAVGKVRGAR
jgi:hypothetical protein